MSTDRRLTVGDIEVARIGLGTNRLTNTSENRALLREALAAGINMIDTAHLYTGGESERTIAAALSPFPDGCVVATKGGYHDATPEVLRAEIEESLGRLETDTIELYYLHRVDRTTPIETSVRAIKDYQDQGKIRHIGLSEVSVEQIEQARTVATIAAVQNEYSLSQRRWDDVVDYCAEHGIPFVPYFPVRGQRSAMLSEIAASHGATPQQVALAWLLKRSPTTVPIPGTLSIEHMRQNLDMLELELTDDEYRALM